MLAQAQAAIITGTATADGFARSAITKAVPAIKAGRSRDATKQRSHRLADNNQAITR